MHTSVRIKRSTFFLHKLVLVTVMDSISLAAFLFYGHTKILHTLLGMVCTALAAAVVISGKGNPNFPQRMHEF